MISDAFQPFCPDCDGALASGTKCVYTQVDDVYLQLEEEVYVDAKTEEEKGIKEEHRGVYTCTFYDEIRRTDFLLVINETDGPDLDPVKMDFLMGLMRLGLHLEFHRGKAGKERRYLFVKIHATKGVLEEYSGPMGLKKYFAEVHHDHMGEFMTWDELLLTPLHEPAWIKCVRDEDPASVPLSTNERSMLVFMLMREMVFDSQGKHLSVEKMLSHKIIVDAYALHDGPYFFIDNQQFDINARQILFYNWIGVENAFRYQPKHLIQEYFGPKIGFYFAYYEFYNKFLFVLAWAGLVTHIFQRNNERTDMVDANIKHICEDNTTVMCPMCSNFTFCPMTIVRESICPQMEWAVFYDNCYTFAYCVFIFIWAVTFYVCWRRQEMFYIWIWELKYPDINFPIPIMRSEYPRKKFLDGRWCIEQSFSKKLLKFAEGGAGALAIMALSGYIYYHYYTFHLEWPGMYQLHDTKLSWDRNVTATHPTGDKREYILTGTHKILAVLTAMFFVIMFGVEMVGRQLVSIILSFENHRTHIAHEHKMAVSMFAMSCLACFPIPAFFGWLKGAFHSGFPRQLEGEWFHITCGFYCLDMFVMTVIILFLIRVVLWNAVQFWSTNLLTDFSLNTQCLLIVPSWEREHRLSKVTETQLMSYYNELMLQFAIITLLSPWFPLMPMIAFLINWYDLKHKACLLLKHSRRATLLPTDGILQWNTVLKGIVVAIPIVHSMTLARNLKTGFLYIYVVLFNYRKDYLNVMRYVPFRTENYEAYLNFTEQYPVLDPEKPVCYGFGMYGPPEFQHNTTALLPLWSKDILDYLLVHDSSPRILAFYKNMYDVLFVIVYIHVAVIIMLVVLYFVPLEVPWVLRFMRIEKAMKRLYVVSGSKIPEEPLLPVDDPPKTRAELCK